MRVDARTRVRRCWPRVNRRRASRRFGEAELELRAQAVGVEGGLPHLVDGAGQDLGARLELLGLGDEHLKARIGELAQAREDPPDILARLLRGEDELEV